MKRILIVEDEKSISELQKDYLEINGFEVEIEHTGNQGLERAFNAHSMRGSICDKNSSVSIFPVVDIPF